jgi:hypothetical protein
LFLVVQRFQLGLDRLERALVGLVQFLQLRFQLAALVGQLLSLAVVCSSYSCGASVIAYSRSCTSACGPTTTSAQPSSISFCRCAKSASACASMNALRSTNTRSANKSRLTADIRQLGHVERGGCGVDPRMGDHVANVLRMLRVAAHFLPDFQLPIWRDGRERLGGRGVDCALAVRGLHRLGQCRQLHALAHIRLADAKLGGDGFNALGFLPRQLGEGFGLVQRVHRLADKVFRQRQGVGGVVVHRAQDARHFRRSG